MMNSLISGWLLILASSSSPSSPQTVEDVFTPEHRNMLVMQVEAAIANAQARGHDTQGHESEGYFHAQIYLARPEQEATAISDWSG